MRADKDTHEVGASKVVDRDNVEVGEQQPQQVQPPPPPPPPPQQQQQRRKRGGRTASRLQPVNDSVEAVVMAQLCDTVKQQVGPQLLGAGSRLQRHDGGKHV